MRHILLGDHAIYIRDGVMDSDHEKLERPVDRAEPDEYGISGFGRTPREVSVKQRIRTAKKVMARSDRTTRAIRERYGVSSSDS